MKQLKLSRKQAGVSLMEVLISLFVLAIGVLGVLALQVQSTRFNTQSYSLSQAVILANSMAEKIRANKVIADDYVLGDIDASTAPNTSCDASSCANADIIESDIENWSYELQKSLPNGRGAITGAAPEITITIQFDSSTEGMDFETDGDWSSYSMVVGV